MKKIIFIILTIIGVLTLCFAVGEATLRLFWDGKPGLRFSSLTHFFFPEPDREIGFVLKPNTIIKFRQNRIKTNEFGFRIPREIKFEKKKGLFRIVMLGDSVVFGYNTADEHTISSRIEKYIKKYNIPGANRTEVLNFGVPGYNMTQYLAVLKKYALKYEPDLIIVGLTILNDFDGFFMSYLVNGYIYAIPVFDSKGFNYELKAPPKLLWNSYFFRFFYYKLTDNWEKLTKGPKNPPGENRRFRRRLPASCNRDDEIWTNIKSILDEYKQISRERKTDILFLVFPTAEQVYYNGTKTQIPLTTQQIIIELLKENDLPYIDLFDIFYSNFRASKRLPFFDAAAHPDNLGSSLAASLAVSWIIDHNRLTLKDSFTGHLDIGGNSSAPFLAYGWTNIRGDGDKFRLIEGSEARIVFDKFRDNIGGIKINVSNMKGCPTQELKVKLNGHNLGVISINPVKGFGEYQILLKKKESLKEINYLDISLSCAASNIAQQSTGKRNERPRYFSVAVKSIDIR
jgi:hypothetical protein